MHRKGQVLLDDFTGERFVIRKVTLAANARGGASIRVYEIVGANRVVHTMTDFDLEQPDCRFVDARSQRNKEPKDIYDTP